MICRSYSRVGIWAFLAVIGILSLGHAVPSQTAWPDADARIVSIGGSVTEVVYRLGVGNRLVGADTSSTYPEAATRLPQVGYQRMLSAEGVLSLKPSLILASAEAGRVERCRTRRCECDCPWLCAISNRAAAAWHRHRALATVRRVARDGVGVLAVLHDLNLAAQYGDRILVLKEGRQQMIGRPWEVLTPALIEDVFEIAILVMPHPRETGLCIIPIPGALSDLTI